MEEIIKVYLSPSDQTRNLYKVGNTTEAEQCREIAKLCVPMLKRCGFEAMTNTTGDMYARVKESNAWGANSHIPIHTNASDGKVAGFRAFYYKNGCEGHKLAAAIESTVAPITPGKSDGLSARCGLYEINATNADCAYLELGFHDNAVEAQYIIDHKVELAEAICEGVCKHYGKKYIAPEQDKLHKVQVGAFRVRANAESLLKDLKAAGYSDAFIVTE